MAAGETFPGRRRPDVPFGDEFELDPQPGDFWRYLDRRTGEPMAAGEEATQRGNLTGGVWGVCSPNGLIGTLRWHTVREHEDGTISVRPGDGSSNSILMEYPPHGTWHGYIEQGIWSEV